MDEGRNAHVVLFTFVWVFEMIEGNIFLLECKVHLLCSIGHHVNIYT